MPGRRTRRMGFSLRRFLLVTLLVLCVCSGLCSCAVGNYPRPRSWPNAHAADTHPCGGINGTYVDRGSSSCDWLPPAFASFSRILEPVLFHDLFPARRLGTAHRIGIRTSEGGRVHVMVFDKAGNPIYLSPASGLRAKCGVNGIELSYRLRIDPCEGVSFVSGRLLLYRGTDGSLICRVSERRLFCPFLIPLPLLSSSCTVWYRFESLEAAGTAPEGAVVPEVREEGRRKAA